LQENQGTLLAPQGMGTGAEAGGGHGGEPTGFFWLLHVCWPKKGWAPPSDFTTETRRHGELSREIRRDPPNARKTRNRRIPWFLCIPRTRGPKA
jgi:hypothetical protein